MIVRVNASGWAYRSILTSAQMNAVDTNVTNALDKRSGFSDTLASQITITGSINATTLLSADLNLGIAPHVNDLACHNINLTAQAPDPSAVTNKSTGNINLIFPAPDSGGNHGTLNLIDGGKTMMTVTGNSSTNVTTISSTFPFVVSTVGTSLTLAAGSNIQIEAAAGAVYSYSSSLVTFVGNTNNTMDFYTGGLSAPVKVCSIGINTSSGLGFVLGYPTTSSGNGLSTQIIGQNATSNVGGQVAIVAGNSGTTTAGTVLLSGGLSQGNGTNHGNVSIAAGGDALTGTNTNGGNVFITGGYPTGSGTKGNISLNGNGGSINWAGGSGIVYLGPSTVAPSGSVGNGGVVLWVDSSGNLRCQTSGGNNRLVAAV